MSGVLSAQNRDDSVNICGRVDLVTVSLQFLYFKPGQLATPAVHKDLQVKVDTIGPSPPSGITILPGNGRLEVSWQNISGDSGVSLLTGVRVYCEPTAVPAAADASVDTCREQPITIEDDGGDGGDADPEAGATDAGTVTICEDAGPTTPVCTAAAFDPPDGGRVLPTASFNAMYQCGGISGNQGTTVKADNVRGQPLVNFTNYAVAVAATDAFDNVGPLSRPLCGMPEPTTDFWDQYRASGGQSGGGFCSATAAGLPLGSVTVLGVVGVALVSAVVRRRRRK
jgi:hypothetical protein